MAISELCPSSTSQALSSAAMGIAPETSSFEDQIIDSSYIEEVKGEDAKMTEEDAFEVDKYSDIKKVMPFNYD